MGRRGSQQLCNPPLSVRVISTHGKTDPVHPLPPLTPPQLPYPSPLPPLQLARPAAPQQQLRRHGNGERKRLSTTSPRGRRASRERKSGVEGVEVVVVGSQGGVCTLFWPFLTGLQMKGRTRVEGMREG